MPSTTLSQQSGVVAAQFLHRSMICMISCTHIPGRHIHKHNQILHCKAQISPYDLRSAPNRFTVCIPFIYLAGQIQASHVHHRVLSCPKQEAPRPLTHDSRKAVSNRSLMTACLSGLCWATAADSLLWGSPAMCSSNHLRTALLVWM